MGPWVCARWCQPPSVRETPTEGTQAHGSLAASNHRSTSHKCLSSKGNWGAERERVGLRGGGPPGSRHFESHSGHLSLGGGGTLPEDVGVQALPSVLSPHPFRGLGASGLPSLGFLPALPWGSHHLLRRPPEVGCPDLGACPTPCKHPKSVRKKKRKLASSFPRLGVRPPATAATIRVALGEE